MIRNVVCLIFLALFLAACGSEEPSKPAQKPVSKAAPSAPASNEPDAYDKGIVMSLAQFIKKDGKSVPGPARLEFLYREGGEWKMAFVEDADSNVFHKAMAYDTAGGPVILTLSGSEAHVKTWTMAGGTLTPNSEWNEDFGGKWSRMRDAEVADLYADGKATIAVATHDRGIVAMLRPQDGGGFEVVKIDEKPDTFVHEIEIGDVDGDGVLEVYATPSEPNRLDGSPQTGEVVRYVPKAGGQRTVVADLGLRHAKEILVDDVDGDGRDELYVSVEGHIGENKELLEPVEIRRYDADTPADQGVVIADLDDRLCRFLTAGDIDGDGKKELVAAAYSSGVWLLRPGSDPKSAYTKELIDADSAGFEHAAIFTDLDGDGKDELYVASDKHKEVRRYTWDGGKSTRTTIYVRPDNRPIFTWNLMPVPVSLIPAD